MSDYYFEIAEAAKARGLYPAKYLVAYNPALHQIHNIMGVSDRVWMEHDRGVIYVKNRHVDLYDTGVSVDLPEFMWIKLQSVDL